MLSTLPLIRDSAEPAFDQVNDSSFALLFDETDTVPNWADAQNWSDQALDAVSDNAAHLTLQRGTLNEAVIDTMMRLTRLTSLELVNVEITPGIDIALHNALVACPLERIYFTGFTAPYWLTREPEKIASSLFVKLACYGTDQWIGTSNLQRLDTRDTLPLASLNDLSLVHGDQILNSLICNASNGPDAGRALVHLRVRHLTLTGGGFGDDTARGLEWNRHIQSVTLIDVPLKQDWVHQMLRMTKLASLTFVRPQLMQIASTPTLQFAPHVDEVFVDDLMRFREEVKMPFIEMGFKERG
ncbi:hypothetical protein [Robbsia sp. KACC 23696]|uniref:hypothetical protein n=1 Tax=Robbsia sp. KACC 23696 TaxID=3149231 RepID=UPI00325BBB8B